MSERTVLSDEQLRNLRLIFPSLALDEAAIRAVERAVLEAVHPQCTDPIVGEHGHPLCGEVERVRARIAELEQERDESRLYAAERERLISHYENALCTDRRHWIQGSSRPAMEMSAERVGDVMRERDAARRELAEAREDTARLDFCEAEQVSGYPTEFQIPAGLRFRSAIDAAREHRIADDLEHEARQLRAREENDGE